MTPAGPAAIARGVPSFPRLLRRLGYRTGYFTANPAIGEAFGMDEHFDFERRDDQTAVAVDWPDIVARNQFAGCFRGKSRQRLQRPRRTAGPAS